jgi:hypothetical protein
MMNAQILPKTFAQSGHTAQPLQGQHPGSSPSRTQDTSEPLVTTRSTQDSKQEASDSPNDFKQALTEKMAEPQQEPEHRLPMDEEQLLEGATCHKT